MPLSKKLKLAERASELLKEKVFVALRRAPIIAPFMATLNNLDMKKQLDILLRILGGIFLTILLLWFFNTAFTQSQKPKYRITFGKVATWTGYSIAGVAWGMREAYHADPFVFEVRWGATPRSFFGSRAWERNYYGNIYYDGAKHKPELGNSFRDVYHFTGLLSRGLWVGTTFAIGSGKKQNMKHKLLDVAIGGVVSSLSANFTYRYLRKG